MNRALWSLLLVACGPVVGADEGGQLTDATPTTGSSQSDTGAPADTTTGASATSPGDDTTSDVSTSDDPTSEDDDSVEDGFIIDKFDFICLTHCPPLECSTWEQDCTDGEKCVPWANDGGDTWNNKRCTPIDPTPALVGEPCVAQGSGVSGIDDCEAGSICWGVDPYSLEGECVAMCAGTEEAPVCPGSRVCVQLFEETVNVCVVPCDPLEPSCGEWEACIFTGLHEHSAAFTCMPTPPLKRGNYGDVCEGDSLETCDSGLLCVIGDLVPGCRGTDCCTLLGDPEAPPVCPDPQQSCVQFERDFPEHCVCVVPQ